MSNLDPQSETTTTTSSATPPSQPTLTQIYLALQSYPFTSDPEYISGLAAILGHPEVPATQEEIEQKADLVLQAQCFYFARKYNVPPIDPGAYSAWVMGQPGQGRQGQAQEPIRLQNDIPAVPPSSIPSTATGRPTTAHPDPVPAREQEQQPPYPTSFAAIVDLITRNIPVPGIEEIPTTVLEPGSSKIDKTPRRRKPWEKDHDDQAETPGGADATNADLVEPAGQQTEAAGGEVEGESTTHQQRDGPTSNPTPIDINGHRETGTGVVNILKPNAVPDSGLLAKD